MRSIENDEDDVIKVLSKDWRYSESGGEDLVSGEYDGSGWSRPAISALGRRQPHATPTSLLLFHVCFNIYRSIELQ